MFTEKCKHKNETFSVILKHFDNMKVGKSPEERDMEGSQRYHGYQKSTTTFRPFIVFENQQKCLIWIYSVFSTKLFSIFTIFFLHQKTSDNVY